MKPKIPIYDIGTISNFRKDEILVSRFGPYSSTHHNLHSPHRHNFFHIVLFTEGEGSHTIDFEIFPVVPYQIYFMIPGQVHSWNFDGPVDGYVINFSDSFFQSFLFQSNYLEQFNFFTGSIQNSVINIPQEIQKEISNLFEEILLESNDTRKYNLDLVRILLLKVFILISRFTGESNVAVNISYNYTLLKNFQLLLEKHFLTLRLPKEYAELLYITPHHLNAICREFLGISTGEAIRNRIILEAKRLLINLDLSISEVSYQLNFNDNSYFTRLFKKQVGSTPEEFRKKVLNKDKTTHS